MKSEIQAFYVELSDYDSVYVLAGFEAEAIRMAIEEWEAFSGFDFDTDGNRERVKVEAVPELDGDISPRRLVETRRATWSCYICDACVVADSDQAWSKSGDSVLCEDCCDTEKIIEAPRELRRSVFLSADW